MGPPLLRSPLLDHELLAAGATFCLERATGSPPRLGAPAGIAPALASLRIDAFCHEVGGTSNPRPMAQSTSSAVPELQQPPASCRGIAAVQVSERLVSFRVRGPWCVRRWPVHKLVPDPDDFVGINMENFWGACASYYRVSREADFCREAQPVLADQGKPSHWAVVIDRKRLHWIRKPRAPTRHPASRDKHFLATAYRASVHPIRAVQIHSLSQKLPSLRWNLPPWAG